MPRDALISDDGWSVVEFGFHHKYVVVSPDGEDVLRVMMVDATHDFAPCDSVCDVETWNWPVEDWVRWGSGRRWLQVGPPYFLTHDGGLYFVATAARLRRLVIDIKAARIVGYEEQETSGIRDACMRREADEAVRIVQAACDALSRRRDAEDDGDQPYSEWLCKRFPELRMAVYFVGAYRLRDHLALLESLELIDRYRYEVTFVISDRVWMCDEAYLLPILQLSIKRLGGTPKPIAPYWVYDRSRRPEYSKALDPHRRGVFEAISSAGSMEDFLVDVGVPSFVRWGGPDDCVVEWEYDFFEKGQWTTIRLRWEREETLPVSMPSRLVSINQRPATWLDAWERETYLLCRTWDGKATDQVT
ncbi:MAG TPA: hypothetical protein P5081_21595 [Phycisphaerae bacterium]|nr:hypothetical protein [Phycisphaerae bacterium]